MRVGITTVCSAIVFCCLLGQNAVSQETKKAAKKSETKSEEISLVGSWKIEAGTRAGEEIDSTRLPGEVVVDKKSFTMPAGPDANFVMAYEIDETKSPIAVDFEITEGPAEGTAKGILKLADGKLTLCYNPMGTERPDAFESTEDNGCFLFVMTNAKSEFNAKSLLGTWRYASGKMAGVESGDERLMGDVVIDKDTFTLPAGPDSNFVMAYEIDSSSSPVAIDLEIKEGPVAEGKAYGIIQIKDGQITLCYNGVGEDRPEKFESTEDNNFSLFVLERKDH